MGSAPPAIGPESLFAGFQWRIIVRGALLDMLLTACVAVPLYLHYAGPDFFAMDPAVSDRAVEKAHQSLAFNLWTLASGLACTALAAGWAGRRVASKPVQHGGWVAVVSALLAVPFLFFEGVARQPAWVEVVGLLGMLPAGLLGGQLAARASTSRGDA